METPLKPVELSVLVALCEEAGHGYELVQRVEAETDGRVSLLPGNLYAVLKKLAGNGWISEVDPPADARDPRRRYYSITEAGQQRLATEAAALDRQVSLARRRLAAL